jgi:hypothetical protein
MTKLLATLMLVSCAAAGSAEDAKPPATAADPPAASKSEGGFDVSALDRSVDPWTSTCLRTNAKTGYQ